ncbi:conserved hypothetical protein [Agrobacterium genomosp. 5 str. CFBP 6626]|nr:conserved hypothetical protein [Agrobacterium genomosp. 5 str. CFBP 6626]
MKAARTRSSSVFTISVLLGRNDAQRQFTKLRRRCRRRRVHQEVLRLLVHREQGDFAQVLGANQKHDHTVDTESATAMRRRAVLEGAVKAAEALFHVALRQTNLFEGLDHQFRRLVTDRAGGDFEAVADRVILEGLDGKRIVAFQRFQTALRHGEGVVGKVDLLFFLVIFEEGEIDDPAHFETVAIDQVQLVGGTGARLTGELVELRGITGNEEAGVARLEAELLAQRLGAFFADVLGERTGTADLAVLFLPEDVAEARLALALRPGVHAIAESARTTGLGRDRPDLNLGVGSDHVGEDLEARTVEMFGHGFHDDRVAQVRLVGTIFADRFVIGNARPLLGDRFAFGELLEHGRHHRLHRGPDVFLGHEAHFDVELIEFARQAVSARIFITEARRDLEITVETGHHQKLLVLLRRLRQREELAFMNTRGHEEVARAFRRRGGEDRRRIFGKAHLAHAGAHGGDDLRALDDVLVQRFAAKIEEAVLQANVFRVLRLAEDRQRQFLGNAQNLDFLCVKLDLAGRHALVDGVLRARLDQTVDADDPFATHRFGNLEGRAIRIGHNLRDAIMVAKVDEENAAMISHAVNPTGKANGFANVGLAESGTGVAAVTMHFYILERVVGPDGGQMGGTVEICRKSAWPA